jgi:predicted alpha/beta-fold hydrolase
LDSQTKCSPPIQVPNERFIALPPFERIAARPGLTLELTDYGGHLGFLGPDGNGGVRWAERRIAAWLLERLRSGR